MGRKKNTEATTPTEAKGQPSGRAIPPALEIGEEDRETLNSYPAGMTEKRLRNILNTLNDQPTGPSAPPRRRDGSLSKPSKTTGELSEQGDETAMEQAAEQKKSSWQPRTTIAIPLTEEAKRDHTKGEVARHVDGYNSRGVGVRIDSPDDSYRPSEYVKEPLKEHHPGHDALRWNTDIFDKKAYRKRVTGRRKGGPERNPVAERLDTEERFEEMVRRRKEEIGKDGGRDPL